MRDYDKARQYYSAAINNMQHKIAGGDSDAEHAKNLKSIAQQQVSQGLALNKFLLAIRYFQRGIAALEVIKRDYPVRQLLESKTYMTNPEASTHLRASQNDENKHKMVSNAARSMEFGNLDDLVAMARDN